MQEVDSLPGLPVSKLRSPVSDYLFHVVTQAFQVHDLFLDRLELAFEHAEHSLAGNSAAISRAQDLGQFGQGKSKPKRVTDHLDSI
jgi:hypothetical protein